MTKTRLGFILAALLSLAALASACSSSEPVAPTPTPVNFAELIQQTVDAQPQGVTAEEVASAIQQAMAQQEGVTAADVASAVQQAMAEQPGVTQEQVAGRDCPSDGPSRRE